MSFRRRLKPPDVLVTVCCGSSKSWKETTFYQQKESRQEWEWGSYYCQQLLRLLMVLGSVERNAQTGERDRERYDKQSKKTHSILLPSLSFFWDWKCLFYFSLFCHGDKKTMWGMNKPLTKDANFFFLSQFEQNKYLQIIKAKIIRIQFPRIPRWNHGSHYSTVTYQHPNSFYKFLT